MMKFWQPFADRWAARAARIRRLETRVMVLEVQVKCLADNLATVYNQQVTAASIGQQIGAHVASRPGGP